jgi:hypothetical protein
VTTQGITIALLVGSALILGGCDKRPKTGTKPPSSQPTTDQATVEVPKDEPMDHAHDGPKHDLGKKTVAGYGVAVTQVGDQVRAGKAATFEIKLSRDRNSTVGRPRSVRAWLGNERGDGVAKEKAPWRSKEKFYDADLQAPGKIPSETKLWVEIEVDNTKHFLPFEFKR